MLHVLNWWSLSNDEIKEFLTVNDIDVPYSFKEAIDLADELYRGELKEGVIITNSIIELEKEYVSRLRLIYDGPIYIVAYELNYEEVLNLCKSDELISKVCEKVDFWKYWMSKRTGLDIDFFIPFDIESIHQLREDYEEYKETGNFEYLVHYKDIMNHIFFNTFLELEEHIQSIYFFNSNLIKYGGLTYLKYIIENLGIIPNQEALENTVKSGDLESVKYLIENLGITPNQEFLENTIKSGDLESVKYLAEKFNIIHNNTRYVSYAIQSDSLELVKYLIEDVKVFLGLDRRTTTIRLKRLFDKISGLLGEARSLQNIEIFEYLSYHYTNILDEAKSLQIIGIFEHLSYYNDYMKSLAFMSKDLESIKRAIPNNLRHHRIFLRYAIESGSLEIIKYFFERVEESYRCMGVKQYIYSKSLEILKYFIEECGLTFDEYERRILLVDSIKTSGLETVKYLIEDLGIEVKEDYVSVAISYDKIDIMEYLIEKHNLELPTIVNLSEIINANNLSLFKYFNRLGKMQYHPLYVEHLDKTINAVIENGNLEILRYFIEDFIKMS